MPYQPQFPSLLQTLANAVYTDLSTTAQHAPSAGLAVQVMGEPLHAPQRVYFNVARLKSRVEQSQGEQQALTLCLGTRHCNGHVREACLRRLVDHHQAWVAPFVVQLLGEYVIEIVQFIHANLPQLPPVVYGQFVRENPAFMATTERRAISYWDCYHRRQYPELANYPGLLALRALQQMASDCISAP